MYGTPIQKILIEPPTVYQTLFLDDGNTVVIKTKKSLASWNLHSNDIRSEFKQAAVLSSLDKSLKPKIKSPVVSSYYYYSHKCSQFV